MVRGLFRFERLSSVGAVPADPEHGLSKPAASPQQESAPSSGRCAIDTDLSARIVGVTGSFTNAEDAQCRVKLGQESPASAAHHEFPEFLGALGSLFIRTC